MNRGSTFALVLCTATTVGCASHARVVSLDKVKGTGTVAIPNNTDTWPTYNRTAAEDLIAKQIGPGFRIVSEGEFEKGKSKQISLDGNSASFTQQKITEYRITFERASNLGAPPAAADGTGLVQTGGREPAPLPGAPPGGAPQPPAASNAHPVPTGANCPQ